jgi:hypothetical protein
MQVSTHSESGLYQIIALFCYGCQWHRSYGSLSFSVHPLQSRCPHPPPQSVM